MKHDEPDYDTLAHYLAIAYIAFRLGITPAQAWQRYGTMPVGPRWREWSVLLYAQIKRALITPTVQ